MARLEIRVFVAAAALLAVAVGVVRMRSPQPLPTRRVAVRLIPAGPESLPRSSVPYWNESEIAHYAFDSPQARAVWTPERIDGTYEATRDGLRIRSSSQDPALWRDVTLDASRVRTIRVASSGLTSGSYMQLYWAAPGEPFAEDRMLSVSRDDGTGSLLPTFSFPVFMHPQWEGRIGRLRIDPTSTSNRQIELISVTALDYEIQEELVAAMVQQSFRVDISGDVRRSVLVPPGFPFVREVELPPNAQLRFAFGLEPDVRVGVRFRLEIEDGEVLTTLLDQRMGPSRTRDPVPWQQHTIDLDRFAGRRVRLRFETESTEDLDLLLGFPVVAGLELLVPGTNRPPPNVVLVILDTLRADHLSLYGYGRPTSPRIDAWAMKNAAVFERVVAPAPWTLPSHASLFTGLDSLVHGAYTDEPMSGSDVTLAERLRDEGYVTCAVTGGGYLASEYGLMRGFERVLYFFEPTIDPEQTGNDIESGMERALGWLDGLSERPFFLLFHTYEIHSPYRARRPYFGQFRGSPSAGKTPLLSTVVREPRKEEGFQVRAWLKKSEPGPIPGHRPVEPDELPLLNDLYDSEIAFADYHVGRLLDRLVQLGLDDSTIVIVTSDHGESLGEGGLAGHSSLQECELLVPLIVAAPSRQGAGTRISTQVRLLDVAPTVLDLLDMEPLNHVQGVSLAPLLLGRDANVPDEAWSYAGSSNFGLGLRLANRLKYTYNNSPWPPISGVEALERLDENPVAFPRIATEDQTAEKLRELAREHYEATTSGLRVSLSNRENIPLRIALKGRNLTPLQVKAFAFGGVDIDWKSQTILFTLPPGEEVTLFCEGRVFGELLVEIAPLGAKHGPRRLRRVVDLDPPVQSWQAILTDGEWVDGQVGDQEGVTGVRVAIEGDRVRFHRELHRVTEELHEQLRSLGYVR